MGMNLFTFLRVALEDFVRSNCHSIAAGIAFWTILSLFPLALASISVFSFIYSAPEEHEPLIEAIVRLVPVSRQYLADLIYDVAEARGTLGVLSIAGLLWTSTAVFSAVRRGINHAWAIDQPRPFLMRRVIDLAMLIGISLLACIMVLFTTTTLGITTLATALDWVGGDAVGHVLFEIGAVLLTIGAFLLLYRYVPSTAVTWRSAWIGAIFGGTLFHGVRLGFAWFAVNVSEFNLVYGSLGALIAILIWAYLSSLTIMWGAQIASTYNRIFCVSVIIGPARQERLPHF